MMGRYSGTKSNMQVTEDRKHSRRSTLCGIGPSECDVPRSDQSDSSNRSTISHLLCRGIRTALATMVLAAIINDLLMAVHQPCTKTLVNSPRVTCNLLLLHRYSTCSIIRRRTLNLRRHTTPHRLPIQCTLNHKVVDTLHPV